MGNRGTVDWTDLEIQEGKTEMFLEWLKEDDAPQWMEGINPRFPRGQQTTVADNYKGEKKTLRDNIFKDVERMKNRESLGEAIAYSLFEDTKVIGYWYEGFCLLLRELAVFLEGDVRVLGEGDDGIANITFEDGDVRVSIAEYQWSNHTIEELGTLPELPDEVKLVRKL